MNDSWYNDVITGGAQIGFVGYPSPLAKLVIRPNELTLDGTTFGKLLGMGAYTFSPEQVLSIDPYRGFLLTGKGIQIRHVVADYPQKIVFFCRPEDVSARVSLSGFSPTATLSEFQQLPRRGFPCRWAPVLALLAIWNVLVGYERLSSPTWPPKVGSLTLAAMGIVFAVFTATLCSHRLQRLFMKPGRSFGEVRPAVVLFAAIAGIMATILTIQLAIGAQGVSRKPVDKNQRQSQVTSPATK